MKKLIIVFTVILSLLWQGASSQNLIAVQNGGTPQFYTNLDAAITIAVEGDTIYLPGGIFPLSISINKKLHIIGVGYNSDSTIATLPSNIYGSIIIDSGGSHGSLTGVSLSGDVSSNANVSNYLVRRNVFNGLNLNSTTTKWILIENSIYGQLRSDTDPGASDCLFTNNIIYGFMGGTWYNDYPGFNNCIFRNNIFFQGFYCSYGCIYPVKSPYSNFENNIFLGSTTYYSSDFTNASTFSIFKNNLFVYSWNPPATIVALNNITNQPLESIFISQSGSQMYQLQSICPGKNAGTDGTDIGIYGGAFPWKEGSVPFNPHFQEAQISPTTDSTGKLNVNIKVSAQDR